MEANQPWHWVVIPAMGLCMGEIFYLKELAEDCAADGIYEFFFCGPPLIITGGTGSPINPRSPLASQTRFATLPGSIATTNVSAANASRSRLDTSNLLSRRKEGTEAMSAGVTKYSSSPRKRGPSDFPTERHWIPAFAGMTAHA